MTPEELDHILSSDETLEPSSNFALRVMAAVHREAAEPPPIRFPWVRFGAGVAASGAMAMAATSLLERLEPSLGAVDLPLSSVAPELCYAMAVVLIVGGLALIPRFRFRP